MLNCLEICERSFDKPHLFYPILQASNEWTYRYTPNVIKGDLDSLRENVREYYSTKVRF